MSETEEAEHAIEEVVKERRAQARWLIYMGIAMTLMLLALLLAASDLQRPGLTHSSLRSTGG